MDYAKAKELKDAGFPQMADDSRDMLFPSYEEEERFSNSIGENWQYAYNPTLSELIEACGNEFRALVKGSKGFTSGESEIIGWHQKPEEAVANLWLELNKK